MGSNQANTDAVASKYCSASDSNKSRNDAYKQYIETISPNAYSAYTSCLAMSKKNLKFNLNMAALLPNNFSLSVNFSSMVKGEIAKLSFYAPSGINCSWHKLNSSDINMSSGSSALLNCSRSNIRERTYVNIFRENIGSSDSQLTIPWQGYNKDGIPLTILSDLEKKYNTLLTDNQTLLTSLENSVTAFNSDTCPDEWKEYIPAYGRFIRGLDKTGKIDPEKNRKVGSVQNDIFKKHSHNMGGFKHDNRHDRGDDRSAWAYYGAPNKITSLTGGAETRPKNVVLLYCIKK